MGNNIANKFGKNEKREHRIVMVGLDAAGKTTILFRLKLGEVVTTIPTIGFNVETVEHKNISFTVWDIGGQDKIRPLWKHYYPNCHGVIFVVDSADADRLKDAKRELHEMMKDEDLKYASLLVLANKQDLAQALKPEDIAAQLDLANLPEGFKEHNKVQACCAVNDSKGINEGLDWLAADIKKRDPERPAPEDED